MRQRRRLTFRAVQQELAQHRVTIFRTAVPGEFRVRLTDAPPRTGYYTEDLGDALRTGLAMRAEANRNARGQSSVRLVDDDPRQPPAFEVRAS